MEVVRFSKSQRGIEKRVKREGVGKLDCRPTGQVFGGEVDRGEVEAASDQSRFL